MPPFNWRGQTLQAHLRPREIAVLGTLAGEFVQLIDPLRTTGQDTMADLMLADEDAPQPHDPALRRLFPNAYRDDEAASREFRRYTQTDQAAAKVAAAEAVIRDLAGADDGWVAIAPDDTGAWLTTLTNLRLVLAARLGIEKEADAEALAGISPRDDRAPTAAVFDWCGWLLESLIDAIDGMIDV